MTDTALSCRGLHRYLGEFESRVHVLRGITLDVEIGSVHSIVGPSGCGKSTLLYGLGLLDIPDEGHILIGGEDVSGLSDNDLSQKRSELIGFVFQFHFLMHEFTAAENVMIPMRRLGKLNLNEMRDRAAMLLDAVGLGDKLERPANHLSGGEQQRVAIARSPGQRSENRPGRRTYRQSRRRKLRTHFQTAYRTGETRTKSAPAGHPQPPNRPRRRFHP